MTAYQNLTARFARIAAVDEAGAVLGWDAAAMMPEGGAGARGDQLAVLAGLSHGLLADPQTGEDLAAAEDSGPDDGWHAANLRLMRKAYVRATAVPADLVEALSRANSACEMAWRAARPADDFAGVLPSLIESLNLCRQQSQALAAGLGLSAYDALMDGYQSGIGAEEVAPIFDAYTAFMGRVLPRIEQRQGAAPAAIAAEGPFAADKQEALCRRIAVQAGLNFAHARLDRSAHPFCGGTPSDVRITTRYDESDYACALMGVIHETGHALYERGLPASYARQPAGLAAGMGIHESQSLILEMQAGRSDAFLSWLGPQLHAGFGGDPAAYAPANLARAGRAVRRSLIRVDADEVTYPAHVSLRFGLERAMIGGDLLPRDLPAAWNDGMAGLLGVIPPNDRLGCLQDIHWYCGLWGYFPSYTLGAMAAAQLMQAVRRAVPGLDAAFAAGDLSPLTAWLGTNIHAWGSRLGFNELLAEATGSALDPLCFERHIYARYLD